MTGEKDQNGNGQKADTQVRYRGGRKSPVPDRGIQKGDKVTVIENEGDWKVRTEDGYIDISRKIV